MRAPRRLAASNLRARLAKLNRAAGDTPWRRITGSIRKRFVFTDFGEAFTFMSQVALVAEAMDHHPSWSNAYKIVDVRLSTHSAGGLTALDFELATRIEAVARSIRGQFEVRSRAASMRYPCVTRAPGPSSVDRRPRPAGTIRRRL